MCAERPRARWHPRIACAALLAAFPLTLSAQAIRGRVVDAQTHTPIIGALVELRDLSGKSIEIVLTTGSGLFQVTAPSDGRYLFRVAAIGYTPRPLTPLSVPVDGIVLGDVPLTRAAIRLPDLLAIGQNKVCGKRTMTDAIFGRLLDAAQTALDVIDETIQSHQLSFLVQAIHSKTTFGPLVNYEVADTVLESLSKWPLEAIDIDTLRAVGWARAVARNGAIFDEYYGPDARVLFSDWFLDTHCFSLAKMKPGADTLHILFEPVKKTKLVDIGGDLVLDAKSLALIRVTYTHTNLPKWMPKQSAGGYMDFVHLQSGLWIVTNWALWGPIEGTDWYDHHSQAAGLSEKRGVVLKTVPRDSIKSTGG